MTDLPSLASSSSSLALPTPLHPATVVLIRNLEARLAAAQCGLLLKKLPWDGPRLEPNALLARTMLAWLR